MAMLNNPEGKWRISIGISMEGLWWFMSDFHGDCTSKNGNFTP